MSTFDRFMIAGAHKSSGKTVVSTGLAGALRRAGAVVQTFKKGPDYIDPMWLARASGRACYNLDFNTMGRDEITARLTSAALPGGVSLVEANKGLYDGVAVDGSDSNAEMAKHLGLPVILVIDTVGMTRGIAPLLVGYQAFDPDVTIGGLILNKVGGARHEGKLRRAIETYCDIPVLGSVWRDGRLGIGERHLGLIPPPEIEHNDALIDKIIDIVGGSVDLDAIRAVAASAPTLTPVEPPRAVPSGKVQGLRIGVIRDAAFGFYYPDDLEAFQAAGADLVFIDAINDTELPALDGLFIGGGFPECLMEALSANTAMRRALRDALSNGLPCYAECGGMMYLCDSLSWNGETRPMVGLIAGRAVMHAKPQGRGHVVYRNVRDHPWGCPLEAAKAHEFHYASIEDLPADTRFARTMERGQGIDGTQDGIVVANTLAGFCHMRDAATTPWVEKFLEFVAGCAR